MPSYYTIAKKLFLFHAEVGAAVRHKHVELFKTSFIEQHLDAFAGGKFSFAMLSFNTVDSSAQFGFGPKFNQLLYFVSGTHNNFVFYGLAIVCHIIQLKHPGLILDVESQCLI